MLASSSMTARAAAFASSQSPAIAASSVRMARCHARRCKPAAAHAVREAVIAQAALRALCSRIMSTKRLNR